MITLTYAQLREPTFDAAIGKLQKATNLPPKVAYNVGRIVSALRSEFKTAIDLNKQIIDPFVKKDAEGKAVVQDNNVVMDETKDLNELQAKVKEYFEITFTIERHKLKLDDLEKLDPALTPAEMLALEPLLETDGV